MGQNTTQEGEIYSSEAYFQRQIELYRWRADPLTNTHICQVHFQLQQSLHDRQRLHTLLHSRLPHEHLPLTEILHLTSASSPSREELMSFEQYVCTLSDLESGLSLEELLYVLQAVFSGYESILGKLGKTSVGNDRCFVTERGEVRAWAHRDYKLNEVEELSGGALSSEMSILKKILSESEKLANKHTEYLHFARQFRSYMDRDILHHWTFPNARKLLNNYAYTYALRLPISIQSAIIRIQLTHSHISNQTLESFSRVEYQSGERKRQLQSTGDVFLKNQSTSTPNSSRHDVGRPASLSESCNSRREELSRKDQHSREELKEGSKKQEECAAKTHVKKLSSSDLKHLQDRSKYSESSKLNKSDYLQQRYREQAKNNSKQSSKETSQQGTVLKLKKDRESATIISRLDSGVYNHSTLQGFCVNSTTKMESDLFSSDVQGSDKENEGDNMKASQTVKPKKKLEKKVTTISKYISYYQNEAIAQRNPTDVVEESSEYTKSNHYRTPKGSHLPAFASPTIASPTDSIRFPTDPVPIINKKFTDPVSTPLHKKTTSNDTQSPLYRDNQPISKGKSEYFRNHANSHYSSSNESSHARMCFTVKTVNRLLSNNEVSMHESQGSFMSKSQTSEYHGLLSNMGRSVNVQTEAKQTGSHLNRSINY